MIFTAMFHLHVLFSINCEIFEGEESPSYCTYTVSKIDQEGWKDLKTQKKRREKQY